MAKKSVRVVIPRNAEELISLSESIIAKHNVDPLTSPLAGLDMAAFEALVVAARTKQNQLLQMRRDAETATEDRDGMLGHKRDQSSTTPGTILNFVSRSRDILLGNHRGDEQHLGDYGFDVNKSTVGGSTGGSNGGGTPPATTGSISGKVTDSMSFGTISGAYIEVLGTAFATNSNGTGDFNLNGIPAGDYTVRISAPGYNTLEGPLTITAGSNQVLPVQLSPSV